jgi:ATP-binding cassette subfamily B protein
VADDDEHGSSAPRDDAGVEPVSGGLGLVAWAAGPYRRTLAVAVLLSVGAALLELVPPFAIWMIARDVLSSHADGGHVAMLALLSLVAVLIRFVLAGGASALFHATAFRMQRRLRGILLDHMGRLPVFRIEGRSGDLKKTIVDDVGRLEGVVAHTLPDLVGGLAVPAIAAAALFYVDWRMALGSLAMLPIALVAQAWISRAYTAEFVRWTTTEAAANQAILAYVRGIATLKTFNRHARSVEDVRGAVLGLRDLAVTITRKARYPFALFNVALQTNLVVVLPLGLLLHAAGTLSFSDLVLFLVLGSALTAPLSKVVFSLSSVQYVSTSADRIAALLNETPQRAGDPIGRAQDNTIRFEGVRFAYPGGPVTLDVPSLKIPQGSITAVVGRSGAGKTTLVRLIARMLDCTEGRVTIGGADVRCMAPADLERRISFVLQDPMLFHGTIGENIRLSQPGASNEAIRAAARAANADSFIEVLPQGYDTSIGDHGTKLSGGQKQRIAIARAILKDAPILVLDEATASVDPLAERDIQLGLSKAMEGRSVLVIAHRIATVEHVERIVVLADGRIEAQGNHASLLTTSPTYAALLRAQERASRWMLPGSDSAAQVSSSRRSAAG